MNNRKPQVVVFESSGLSTLEQVLAPIEVVGRTSDPAQINDLVSKASPEIVIASRIPMQIGDMKVVSDISSNGIPVLYIAQKEDIGDAVNWFFAGAKGYVDMTYSSDKLMHAIGSVLKGHNYVNPYISYTFAGYKNVPVSTSLISKLENNSRILNPKELDLYRLLGMAKSTKEIAKELGKSPKTIETRKGCIINKLEFDLDALRRYAALYAAGINGQHITNYNNPENLTRCELEVFGLIGKGYTIGRTAHKLFKSPKTIGCHTLNAINHLNYRNSLELIMYATLWANGTLQNLIEKHEKKTRQPVNQDLAHNYYLLNTSTKDKEYLTNYIAPTGLTKTQSKIFNLIGEGMTRKEVATYLSKSVRTIGIHIADIREHMGYKDNVELRMYSTLWKVGVIGQGSKEPDRTHITNFTNPAEVLTEHQLEIFIKMGKGQTRKKIALEYGLTPKSFNYYVSNMIRCLGYKCDEQLRMYSTLWAYGVMQDTVKSAQKFA